MAMISDIVKSLLTRLIFAGHIILSVWWVVQVTERQQLWYLACFVGVLFVETLVSIFYRKGKEYKWFSPSIFCHLAAIIPCAWILELHLLDARMNEKPENALDKTAKNKWESLISQERWTDLIEQTTLLLMILGRSLLPNDYLTRESLSQLLLVNLAMAADIIEFFDILKLDFVRESKTLALIILSLWSWSLMQFPFNLTATFQSEEIQRPKINQTSPENLANKEGEQFKPRATMSSYDFKQMIAAKRASRSLIHDLPANNHRRYSCQPILESEKISFRKASQPENYTSRGSIANLSHVSRERPREPGRNLQGAENWSESGRRLSVSGRRVSVAKPSVELSASYLPGAVPSQGVFLIEEETAETGNHVTTIDIAEMNEGSQKSRITGDLVMSFMSLFMEDCPFLTVRLLMIAYYNAFGYMIIFLTVKNALVLTLQVYRLCILYCICHDHKENDFSPENEVDQHSRLANVQIAVTHDGTDGDSEASGRKKGGWRQATRNIRSPLFFSRAFSRDS